MQLCSLAELTFNVTLSWLLVYLSLSQPNKRGRSQRIITRRLPRTQSTSAPAKQRHTTRSLPQLSARSSYVTITQNDISRRCATCRQAHPNFCPPIAHFHPDILDALVAKLDGQEDSQSLRFMRLPHPRTGAYITDILKSDTLPRSQACHPCSCPTPHRRPTNPP